MVINGSPHKSYSTRSRRSTNLCIMKVCPEGTERRSYWPTERGHGADLGRGRLRAPVAELDDGSVTMPARGDVHDPAVDLRRYSPSGSNTVTFGEQKKKERNIRVLPVSGRPRERELKGPLRNL